MKRGQFYTPALSPPTMVYASTYSSDELAAGGLRTTQHSLLAQIDKMNGPTFRVLATELVMDLSALGHTFKPLIRDTYIILVPDKDDRGSST